MEAIGKVTHYYGKIGVAIVELSHDLKVGDKIKIQAKQNEFEQVVQSLEVEHKPVDAAQKGDVIGLKVVEKTSEGATVYKLEG